MLAGGSRAWPAAACGCTRLLPRGVPAMTHPCRRGGRLPTGGPPSQPLKQVKELGRRRPTLGPPTTGPERDLTLTPGYAPMVSDLSASWNSED